MKQLVSSACLIVFIGCAPVKQVEQEKMPPVSPAPVEEVVVEQLEDKLKDTDVRNARSRARKLFEIILGGVNK